MVQNAAISRNSLSIRLLKLTTVFEGERTVFTSLDLSIFIRKIPRRQVADGQPGSLECVNDLVTGSIVEFL
jgi:hypothetical protein